MRWPSMSMTFSATTSGDAQARAVGDAERGPVLQAGRGSEQSDDLILVQHDRRFARFVHARQMANEVGPLQRHVEEEPQRRYGGVDGRNADPLLCHMHLEAANVLARRAIRRAPEEGCEPSHMTNVILLD